MTAHKLDGQVALVTGAQRGIGKSIATRLAVDGADLAILDLDPTGLEATRAELLERFPGRRVLALPCDVSAHEPVAAAVDRVIAELGRVDILVNNAGVTRDNLLLRMSEKEWDTVLAVNLKGVFNLSKAVSRHMVKARSGRIVNIAGIVGMIGNKGQTNYSASKAGVIAFSFSLARELASRGVTVNAVAPGFIETDMTQKLSEETRQALQSQIPLGRLGTADDVAEVVAFLSSSAASYITGEVIRVDGGMAMS